MADICESAEGPTDLFEDNQGTIAMAKNPVSHSCDIKYHYVREAIQEKAIQVTYCPTENMLADLLTKPLPRVGHQSLRKLMELP